MADTSKVEQNSATLEAIVDNIVKPYTKELDNYIANLKNIASENNYSDLSIAELNQSLLFISTCLYNLVSNTEKTALKQAVSASIKQSKYNDVYSVQTEGTIADRKAIAESAITEEALVELIYKSAYSRLKNLYTAGENVYAGLRKIANIKTQEMQLAGKKEYLNA